MTLEDELGFLEPQTNTKYKYYEPPEATPKKTNTFQDLKVLATIAIMVEIDHRLRPTNRAVYTRLRHRGSNRPKGIGHG